MIEGRDFWQKSFKLSSAKKPLPLSPSDNFLLCTLDSAWDDGYNLRDTTQWPKRMLESQEMALLEDKTWIVQHCRRAHL